jgi:gamma-glutamyl:cysteine ligase YbdK (ATP-grasp superfamily)
MLLLNLIQEIDDERLPKLLPPIWAHLADILVPFQQVASMHAALLALIPQQRVEALVLAWHHAHLCSQSHGKNKPYHQRESQSWLDFAPGLLGDPFPWLHVLVFDHLDSMVKASSLVEMVHALIRPYLNRCKGYITQETLNLIMFDHNHRRYNSGRRTGKAPIELLTGEALQADWVELFIQHKQEVSRDASGAARPALEVVLGRHGQTPPSETPSGPAICAPSADAGHPWPPMDVEAA